MQNKKLQAYLYRTDWSKEDISNDRLEIMLTASCLRFLEGLTALDFVLELAEAIRKRENSKMRYQLLTALDTLHDLSKKLQQKDIAVTNTKTVKRIINATQKSLTARNYL